MDSPSNSEVTEVLPTWGAFPAEQYLLQHWDPSCSEPPVDQRRRLIRDFVHILDSIPPEWVLPDPPSTAVAMAIVPTPAQVRDVLAPWRPRQWRFAVREVLRSSRLELSVWVRTHYAADPAERARDGERLRGWLETDDGFNANIESDTTEETIPWRVLDDPLLFDFGDDWERVFEVLPELAGPEQGLSRRFTGPEGWDQGRYLESLQQMLRENVSRMETQEEKLEAVECGGNDMQVRAVDSYLLLADEEAICCDEEIWTMDDQIRKGKIQTSEFWDSSDVGTNPGGALNPKYGAFGEISRELYGVEDLL
ncbi:hypothetical protein QBC33DRAFT_567608 [Phialemonium atrogriseum]|uniref:Uncharacterized protein n=1 Tax=Phialemonium atrogriseum TaxID=1093897 RepID=A0AAJ0C6A0_9PEZI|nr:uncharacterized protein QBC33DRAFT_567608 [Phialemonium atrogriseum]KAK1770267.1 hypothetical protein QBC33DRAFT_567608 [Phialemonium atrogriseum]